MNKAKLKKIGDIFLNILMYVFLAVCVIAVILTLFSKKDDGAVNIFGYQMRIVTSDSMEACEYTDVSDFEIKDIPVTSMVFIESVPDNEQKANEWYKELKAGDVLTFVYNDYKSNQDKKSPVITHRITSISESENGGYTIELKGDNKNSEDGALAQTIYTSPEDPSDKLNYVIGRVVGHSPAFGAAMTFMKQPVAIVLLIIVPCVAIMLAEVIKIVKTFTADKRKREQEEKEKKDNELDELRRRLAELENASGAAAVVATEQTKFEEKYLNEEENA